MPHSSALCIELLSYRDVLNFSSGDAEVSAGLQAAPQIRYLSGERESRRLVGAGPHRDSGVFCGGAPVREAGQLINTALLHPILRNVG